MNDERLKSRERCSSSFILALLLITTPALPQCTQTPVFSDPFRLSMFDVAIDGSDLWAATGYGIALYDRGADPPRLAASIAIPGTTRIVRPANGLVYAGSGSSLVVIRKNGRKLDLLRTINAGAPINDMAAALLSLFVATPNGIAQYDLSDPTRPVKTSAPFPTSQTAVSSLAIIGSTLYAADGDNSVESFSVTTLQPAGTITAPANALSVHAGNGNLLVSSALQTSIFTGGVNVGTIPAATSALASISTNALFIAGGDRTIRGVDLTKPGDPIDIFRDELPATGGNVNRVNALAAAGGSLYVAAGDIGLVTYDVSSFTQFPLRGTAFPGANSVLWVGDRFYAGTSAGVTEFNASLVKNRSWDSSHADVVQDGDSGLLLTASGSSMTLWTLNATPPQPVATATFPDAVTGAVLVGTTGYAVLANRSLDSADFAKESPVPQPVTVPLRPSSIARSGTAIVLADARDDGTTEVAWFASLPGAPRTITIPGLPTTPVTLSGSTAAVQTFQGISIVDFGTGTQSLLPKSNDVVARRLFLSGTTLLELTNSTLRAWNTRTGTFDEVMPPSQPVAVHVAEGSTTAAMATATDAVTVALDRLSQMPLRDLPPNGSAFYKKIAVSASHIDLADDRGIDIFSTSMHYLGSIRAADIVDLAASDEALFTISSSLVSSSWSPDGFLRSSTRIDEGADAQALSVAAVGGAAWVSIIRGCTTSGACEKKTLVFNGPNQTTSMTGGIVDVVTKGNHAYAITDIPSEVRVIDISDPSHPSVLASKSVQAPRSISYAGGTLFVLGGTLTPYSESDLTKGADILGPYTTDGTVTLVDQHLRIDGDCAVMTGRTSSPQRFALPQWTVGTSFGTPSTARFVVARQGTFYVLTDHSLEIWSNAPLPKLPRRAPGR